MNSVINDAADDKTYAVMLPCEPGEFGEFIAGLLGKPQTIVGRQSGVFEINRHEVANLYHLVVQRVEQQNKSSMVQFTIRIVFSDGSSVLLDSLNAFDSYIQIRPITCVQIHLSWSFLIKFQDKHAPEKQDIDVSFLSEIGGSVLEDDAMVYFPGFHRIGTAVFRIRHTARTWGADIEGLLSSHLKTTVLPEPKVRKFIRVNSSKIAVAAGATFFFAVLGGICAVGARVLDEHRDSIAKSVMGNATIDQKINALIKFVSAGLWEKISLYSLWYGLAGFLFAIIIAIWVEHGADNARPSFIVLTKQDEARKVQLLKKYERKWLGFITSIIVGVGTGVVGNIIYSKLWS